MNPIDYILSRTNMSETKQKVVRNLFWAVLGKVVTLLGSLLVGIFVARYLGPEQYGLMNYIVSYVALFQVFASFGMDNIEIREEAKCKGEGEKERVPNRDANRLIGTALGLKLGFAVLTMIAVCATAYWFEADSYTKAMVCVYSLSMVFQAFGVIRNYFTAIVWNEYVVKTEISRTVIGAAIKVVLLCMEVSLSWFIVATLFDCVLIAGGYVLSYRKQIASPRLWEFDKKTAVYLVKESFPLMLSAAAIILYQRIDQVMIGRLIDKEAVGYFSVAVNFVSVLLFIPTILSQTIAPELVRLYEKSEDGYAKKSFSFLSIVVWLCIISSALLAVIASPLVRYTFGEEYLPAIVLLEVMSFKVIGMALSQAVGQMIIIEHLQKYSFIRNLLGCVFCVVGNLLFIPRYGAMGAAIMSVLTTLFVGWIANVIIPVYRKFFVLQTKAIFCGWRELGSIAQLRK